MTIIEACSGQETKRCAGNGSPFSSIATQYPGLSRLPFGRDAKRSSALLRALERASHSLRHAPSG
ncbi:MAG: hypothetical protein P8179_09100 [Candidatus Thiodiazotropha sp.]